MAALQKPGLTPDEYLEIERNAETKSEYFGGQMFAMAGASESHNLVALNVAAELQRQMRGRPCRVYTNDMRVQVSESGLYTYPDVIAVCGERQFRDERRDTLLNPTLLVEVLSETTASYDRLGKFALFRRLPSLCEYVLMAQDEPRIERYVRQADGSWNLTEMRLMTETVTLDAVGCTLTLTDIYADVEFPVGQIAATGEKE